MVRRSYLQRLAAPLTPGGPALFPLAQASPSEARPAAVWQSGATDRLPQTPAPAPDQITQFVAAPVVRLKRTATRSNAPKTAAFGVTAEKPLGESVKVSPNIKPSESGFRTAPPGATIPDPTKSAPDAFAPLFPTPATAPAHPTIAMPVHENAAEVEVSVPESAPPMPAPLIWGEPVALPQATAGSSFEPSAPARPAPKSAGGTLIHIGTVEVRTAPHAVPTPLPAPKAAPVAPPPGVPAGRAYGWRFGLSQG